MLNEPRPPLFGEEKELKETTITFSVNDMSVLIEALTFAKAVYKKTAEYKKTSESDSESSFAMGYSSLLVEELLEKIVKAGRLADSKGVLH